MKIKLEIKFKTVDNTHGRCQHFFIMQNKNAQFRQETLSVQTFKSILPNLEVAEEITRLINKKKIKEKGIQDLFTRN